MNLLVENAASVAYLSGVKSIMPESDASQGKGPIFVVGSPRSGTSILTWCLGQHANILPQEESGWLGELAIALGVQFEIGHKRGERSQLSAMCIERAEFFKTIGDGINEMILRHRPHLEQKSQYSAEQDPAQVHNAFKVSRFDVHPKSRLVDGTPEYSLYIWELKKLFPNAKFVHVVRDVQSVVNSMLNFKTDDGDGVVKTEQEAYEYWIRTVQACMQAELALGKQAMYRLRYDDLVRQPAKAISSVLEFLDEPFMPACIEPLSHRINSSNVPNDFCAIEHGTDISVVEHAMQLNRQLQQPFVAKLPSSQAMAGLEKVFDRRVAFKARLDDEYGLAIREIARLQAIIKALIKGLNLWGVMLAAQLVLTLLVNLDDIFIGKATPTRSDLTWLVFATAGAGLYVIIRRAGFRRLAARIVRTITWHPFDSRPFTK